MFVDAFANRTLTGGELMAASIVLSLWLRKERGRKTHRYRAAARRRRGGGEPRRADRRQDSGNLNFTAGYAANESAIARAGIRRLITAKAMVDKVRIFLAGGPASTWPS